MFDPNCPFCQEFIDVESSDFRLFIPSDVLPSRVIDHTANFITLASLGALKEGYLLILSKQHYLSFSMLSQEELIEAQAIKDKTVKLVTENYSTPIVFEHGIMNAQSSTGACVDHAHLQIVPLEVDLFPRLAQDFNYQPISHLSDLAEFRRRLQPYLYYEREGRGFAFIIDRNLPSQYMRRILAAEVGRPQEWDWALFRGKEALLKTVRLFKDKL